MKSATGERGEVGRGGGAGEEKRARMVEGEYNGIRETS